ncbi:MAG TPA: heme biosynthesis HemY N-terminal domain-containing protein [Caulobacteraceae bacterium]|nr:heme biosynthesis HemY N-terminal domain-containing protein [Caulobacteraceae bacterium]
MIRSVLIIFAVAVIAIAVLAVAGEAGEASLTWLGWRVDMTAASAALLVLFTALAATIFWRGLIWLLEAPARAERNREASRRKQAGEVLARGFLAAAAGDGSEARRLAQKAVTLAEDHPALVRVLAAQAAEAAGDIAAAKAAYSAMLGFPEMRLAGHKGLMQTALSEGDKPAALRHAESAYALTRTARWAWRALLESRLEAGDWAAALELVKGALERKIVTPLVAERTRAALFAASAAGLETMEEERMRVQALDYALNAVRLQPGFAPGVVMAARLLAADGKVSRASGLLEHAWKEGPHPALWLAYRDLRTHETPRERAARLAGLAAEQPQHRESRILSVEAALVAGDAAAAREAARPLTEEAVTARIAGLMARVAFADGAPDEARAWIARGAGAPQEPDWSDLDPEGRAFAYTREDWARLVSTYAETGELIHPRLERHERVMSELPELPVSYVESTPFVRAAETGATMMPIPDDPGVGELLQPPAPSDPAPRRGGLRRRLASAPRASK